MQGHKTSQPDTYWGVMAQTNTCIHMHDVNVDIHTFFLHAETLRCLCAVCLKWQCLSVILRQIGGEYWSIKGHGAAKG